MTAPQPHGYSDFGRYVARADKILIQDTVTPTVGNKNYPVVFVGDVPSISVIGNSPTNGLLLRILFYDDAALTNSLAMHSIDIPATTACDVVLPVLGPYMLVQAIISAAGGFYIVSIATSYTGRTGLGTHWSTHLLMNSVATAVGAGITATVQCTRVKPGWATVLWDTALATWLGIINVLDYQNNQFRIDTATNASPRAPRQIFIPPAGLEAKFTNTTGAGGTFTLHVLSLPLYP
jgi:hypothetical protein